VDDDFVKGYYSHKDILKSVYDNSSSFNVYMIEHTYKFGDYERLQRENPKLSRKEARMHIVELLAMLGSCETQMDLEYRNELAASDPFIVEAYETIGKDAIEKLNYREKLIREAMILQRYRERSTGREAILLIKNSFSEDTWYADVYIKKELKRIFKLLDINYPKAITSHTIGDFFEFTDKPTKKKRGKFLYRCRF
jgi:hypothetical protein